MDIYLKNLTCPNCTSIIELSVKKRAEIEISDYNFATKIMSVTFREDADKDSFVKWLSSLVLSLEPDVEVQVLSGNEKQPRPAGGEAKPLKEALTENLPVLAGAAAGLTAFFVSGTLSTVLFLISYLLIGGDVLLAAARNILRGRIFDENFLMSAATIGALFLGDFIEAVAVMLFYKIGEGLSEYAQNRTLRSIDALLALKVSTAYVINGNELTEIDCSEVAVGDLLLIRTGEQVPVDSVVVSGSAYMDTKSITGEPVPVEITEGDMVYAGYVSTDAVITVRAAAVYDDSMISKIIQLTRDAAKNKSRTEKFITRFARYYTPAVVLLALLISTVPPLLGYGVFAEWLKRGMVFLVISCPCALVLSVPLGYFAGIGAASRNGILFKGSNCIESFSSAETAVFDKTGTLTEGDLYVSAVYAPGDEEELKRYLYIAESGSSHPIARAIKDEFECEIDLSLLQSCRELPGRGIEAVYDSVSIKAGTAAFAGNGNVREEDGTMVYASADGRYLGCIKLSDRIKPGAKEALAQLKAAGIKRTVMLSGDSDASARQAGEQVGIDEIYAQLLPEDKLNVYKSLKAEGSRLYIGDGINDAPVLAAADIGIAMGAVGSDAAVEAADVVIMRDNLDALADAVRLSKYTKKIIFQNICFVLAVKLFFLLLGALGAASMGQAVFADVGTSLIAVLNVMRILKRKSF